MSYRFAIHGYYGFGNAGDEAVLAAIVQGLRQRFAGCCIVVLSADPEATRRLHHVQAAQRWSVREVWQALGEADVLLQGGGGLLQDATSKASSLYYLGVLRMARMRGVPAVIFAQGIGPLRSGALRRLARNELSHTAAITVRDERSLQEMAQMGVSGPAPVLVADPAVLLSPAETRTSGAPYAMIVVREWPATAHVVAACRALASHLVADHGLAVRVVPFQEPADLGPCEAVAEEIQQCRMVRGLGHPAEFVAQVASARLVVSMRLHGLIFAAAQAVPALGIAYDPKVNAFAARAGQEVMTLAECTGQALCAAADALLAPSPAAAIRREAVARELRDAAERGFDVLASVLAHDPAPS